MLWRLDEKEICNHSLPRALLIRRAKLLAFAPRGTNIRPQQAPKAVKAENLTPTEEFSWTRPHKWVQKSPGEGSTARSRTLSTQRAGRQAGRQRFGANPWQRLINWPRAILPARALAGPRCLSKLFYWHPFAHFCVTEVANHTFVIVVAPTRSLPWGVSDSALGKSTVA